MRNKWLLGLISLFKREINMLNILFFFYPSEHGWGESPVSETT